MQRSKVGSYLGYTDRDGSLLAGAALDPKLPSRRSEAATLPEGGDPSPLIMRDHNLTDSPVSDSVLELR